MELALIIYLVGLVASLDWVAQAMLIIWGVGGGVLIFLALPMEFEGRHVASPKKPFRSWLIGTFVLALVSVVTPSERTAYAMLAAYGGQQVVESEAMGRLAPKSLQLLEGYMDKHLAELEPAE